jgi:hypothetical protein
MRRFVFALIALTMTLSLSGATAINAQAGGGAAGGAGQGAQRARPLPSVAERTDGFQKLDGFYPLYWDEASGTLYLEIPKLNQEVLYVSGLSAGLGSNDIGLDRAQIGGQKLVRFERVGTKVLMVQPNYSYRAVSNNAAERKAVEDAFAKSILWGFTAIAETSGRVLVDLTDFIMRDTHGVVGNLGAGYRFDRTRSAVFMENTKAFPKTRRSTSQRRSCPKAAGGRGGGPGQIGGRIADVTPSAEAVTLRCIIRSSNCRTATSRREPSTRARDSAATTTSTSRRHSANRCESSSSAGTGSKSAIRRGDERSGEAHHLLRRSRYAGAHPVRAGRGRALVEPGIRDRGLP